MKNRSITVVLVLLLFLFYFGCENPSSSDSSAAVDGTFTATATGLTTDLDGSLGFAIVPVGAELEEANVIAIAWSEDGQSAGTDSAIAIKHPDGNGATWTGTGGTQYDVYIFLDKDDSSSPSLGDPHYDTWPVRYTQNGNKTVSTTYSDDYPNVLD